MPQPRCSIWVRCSNGVLSSSAAVNGSGSRSVGGALHCAFADQSFRLPLGVVREEVLASFGGAGRRAILGIRPTDLVVGAERETALSGEVFLVEPIGPVSYVDVDAGGRAVKAICDPDQAPGVGERVSLGFQTARVRLFDPASENRI